MGIYEQVTEGIKDAMRARDTARTTALRNIRAGFIETIKLDNSTSLTDEQCQVVLRKLAKQRNESIEAYRAGNREDLVAAETAELAVIEGFLPKLADAAQTRAWVTEAITATGAGAKDFGKVMGYLMKTHKDEIDGKLAQSIAKTLLGA
jgi:uncharacterized protein YqeY